MSALVLYLSLPLIVDLAHACGDASAAERGAPLPETLSDTKDVNFDQLAFASLCSPAPVSFSRGACLPSLGSRSGVPSGLFAFEPKGSLVVRLIGLN